MRWSAILLAAGMVAAVPFSIAGGAEALSREQNLDQGRQAIEEARGLAEAQKIISEGLTPEYLTFKYIEQLGTMPPGSVVYVPTEGGVPLMRSIGGGGS